MALPVLYLRPGPMQGNGVRAYSERVIEAFARYGDGRYRLVDGSACLEGGTGKTPQGMALQLGERVVAALRKDAAALVFAEMGVGEFQVFHALRGLKRVAPQAPTLVTVHDPPRTVVNLNPLFHPYQRRTAVRAARWLYNRTAGAAVEAEFLAQGHHWLLLSEQGKRLWVERLAKAGLPGEPLSMLPHLNYCDRILPPFEAEGDIFVPPLPPLQGEGRGEDGILAEDGVLPEKRLLASEPCSEAAPLRLGVLGSITRSKCLDVLLDAVASLAGRGMPPRGLLLEIAGAPLFRQDQRYHEELERQVARLGLGDRVVFSGYLPEEGLPAFFERIDLLVLPYRETGSGSASGPLMWARSFGVPVVASKTRNIPEMVRHGADGLLCAPGDRDSLASALAACNTQLLATLRDGAAARREECSWKSCVAGLSALFDAVIAAQGKGT